MYNHNCYEEVDMKNSISKLLSLCFCMSVIATGTALADGSIFDSGYSYVGTPQAASADKTAPASGITAANVKEINQEVTNCQNAISGLEDQQTIIREDLVDLKNQYLEIDQQYKNVKLARKNLKKKVKETEKSLKHYEKIKNEIKKEMEKTKKEMI